MELDCSWIQGKTLEQLFHCLGSKILKDLNSISSQLIALASPANESKNGDPDLSFVNGLWVGQGLKLNPSFQEIVEVLTNCLNVLLSTKAVQVVAEVNSWAETATRGLIKNTLTAEALKSTNQDTVLILVNALYIKGAWVQSFDTSKTKKRAFRLLNGQTVYVPFMTSTEFEYYHYRSFDGYKILKLPYKNGQTTRKFSMYFFLLDAIDGLQKLIQIFKFNPDYFNQRFNLQLEDISDFWIPRFKFSFEFEASDTMKELGLDLPFDSQNAEITEMVSSYLGLYVEKMFHKSFIEVNEEGTEAAACTVAVTKPLCLRYPIPSFVADHPFMFMSKEETSGVVFFVGAVLNPLES
ncbi:hypothetical protein DITRI_Ditri11bG0026700 [Diplodiscus trichospermus]